MRYRVGSQPASAGCNSTRTTVLQQPPGDASSRHETYHGLPAEGHEPSRSASWPPSAQARARPARPSAAPARPRPAAGCRHITTRVVGVADQHPVPASSPCPVEPVQVDVAQQRRDHPALRGAGHGRRDRARPPSPRRAASRAAASGRPVADPFLDRLHQLVVRNRLETVGDVRLDHPPPAPPGLIDEHLQGIVRRAPRAGTRTSTAAKSASKIGSSTIFSAACTIRSRTVGIDSGRCSVAAGLRDEHPARRQRPIAAVPQVRGQLVEQPGRRRTPRRRRGWSCRCRLRRCCGAP